MGTNFYAKKKLTQKSDSDLRTYIDNGEYDKLLDYLEEYYDKFHIGKRSGGWAFLFQACDENDEEANVPWKNLKELQEYLKRPDIKIVDEYGREYNYDEFWNEEIGEQLYPSDKYYDLDRYYKEHPTSYHFDVYSREYIEDGVRWCNEWFA